VLLKAWVGGYLQVGEELARVARVVVVGGEHLRRHRLAEAAAAGHAAQFLLGEERLVHHGYQPRLVNVLRVADLAEPLVPLVDVYANRLNLRFTDLRFTIYGFTIYDLRIYVLRFVGAKIRLFPETTKRMQEKSSEYQPPNEDGRRCSRTNGQ